jgi:hypothetical protein
MDKPIGPITLLATSRRAGRSTVGVGVALFLLCGIAFAVWWWRGWSQSTHGIFKGKTGPVSLRADWPRPLKELLDDLGEIEIDNSTIQVHCLCGGVYDKEYVWRMDAAPGLFELIEKRWKLTPVNGPDWGVLEGYTCSMTRVQTPAWWSPRDDDQTSFYVSPRGYDGCGDRFRVGVDENRSTIFVHFRYKF